jgi:tetratricopeptide (TPR) repeat protein
MIPRKTTKPWKPETGQWIVFRTDSQIRVQPIDIYVMLQIPSLYAYGFFVVQGEVPEKEEVATLLQAGFKKDRAWAKRLTLPKGDPAETLFRNIAESKGVEVDTQPSALIEPYAKPFKEDFEKIAFSPTGMLKSNFTEEASQEDRESAEASIPDSYDPCPCASGKKYKFCCKKIFREVIMAMCAAEEGRLEEALQWIKKAQDIVGESAEVLCRIGIVYRNFDKNKSEEYLEKCERLFPNHPRLNYIRGIEQKDSGNYEGAIAAYQKAIANYPASDKYHLNEAWNNLGTAYYEFGNYEQAKASWEKALLYLPSDSVVRKNLNEYIYLNPEIPETLREPSPFVAHFMDARKRK